MLLLGIAITVVNVLAFWHLLPRAGLDRLWAFVALVPLGAVVLLWVLAFRPWPGDTRRMGG
ncbi:MAG: hypothetical protein ACFBSD_06775 [Paracoccaceae bacterium]